MSAGAIELSWGRGGVGPHTLGGSEVNHVAVALEHVDLLNRLDGLDVELLERLLQLLVVGAGPGGRALHLSAGGALASDPRGGTELLEALLDVGHCRFDVCVCVCFVLKKRKKERLVCSVGRDGRVEKKVVFRRVGWWSPGCEVQRLFVSC